MAGHKMPYFHNSAGYPAIEIGTKKFMCIGAKPPFDHPHEYLEMGDDTEIVCPYCSTLFKYREHIGLHDSAPFGCIWEDESVA
tara:strand:- start:1723 stop:1971 length:249 start_codon:yes stop_codon:yes gene_type:complete